MLPSEFVAEICQEQIPSGSDWQARVSSELSRIAERRSRIRFRRSSRVDLASPRVIQQEVVRSLLIGLRELANFGVPLPIAGGSVVDVMMVDLPGVTGGIVFLDREPDSPTLDPSVGYQLGALGIAAMWSESRLETGISPLVDWVASTGDPFVGGELPDFWLERYLDESWRFDRNTRDLGPGVGSTLSRAARQLPLPIALARQPRLETTHLPGGPLAVHGGTITLGAVVSPHRERDRRYLTCAHAMPPATSGDRIGCNCRIDRVSDVWDAATLHPVCGECEVKPNSNVLATRAPSRGEWGYFTGAKSGEQACSVDSVDPILPNYGTGRFGQVGRFYTNRCTAPGDSGAVLGIQGSSMASAAGLAVERTVDGEQIEYSMWMWLAGVLDELGVDLVGWER